MRCAKQSLLLYAVTGGTHAQNPSLEKQVKEAILGGATIIQLREKKMDDDEFLFLARALSSITDAFNIPLIINDNMYVACTCGASGLHIGQEDGQVQVVRKLIGNEMILGVSVQTIAQAVQAEMDGADYLGVGAMFPTATKADAISVSVETLTGICKAVKIPVVAIGGIHGSNMHALAGTGIAGIAVVSALFARPEFVRETAAKLKAAAREICNS